MQAEVRRKTVSIGLLGVAVCVAILFTALGIWQLNRAAQKRADFSEFERRGATEINLDQTSVVSAKLLAGHPTTVTGRFIGPTILLDNQIQEGRAGYLVYSVFALDSLSANLLVNRGWVTAEADRSRAPELDTPAINLSLQGRLSEPPQSGLRLAGSDNIEYLTDNVWRVQNIDFSVLTSAMASGIGGELLPITLLLDENAPAGFVREWLPPGGDEDRHLGYAFQWFALAVTVLVVSAILTWRSYSANRQ